MRIRRLELLRYGHFTDRVLELPSGTPDLHVIFGSNEAGKSTALTALEDLLFGIPRLSPLNFLHDYPSMRIGAVLEAGEQVLTFRRRKGNKDTLLSPQDLPLPEGDSVLAAILGNADREFFTRMFFLDHARLRAGGQEILAARDEVGQALFSAGAGLEHLRERLQDLEGRADDLWGPRRAGHRTYYQAEDALKAAEAELREHTVTATDWGRRRDAHEAARQRYDALEQEIQAKETAQRRLQRVRRVYRDVHRHLQLETELKGLGEAIDLPPDARDTLARAERDDRDSATRISALRDELESVREDLATLVCDERLLRHAEDVAQLHERRIGIRADRAELPELRAQLSDGERRLLACARELDWPDASLDELAGRVPSRPRLARVRALLSDHGRLAAATVATRQALSEAQERLDAAEAQLAQADPERDITRLRALVTANRAAGDIDGRLAAAARAEAEAQRDQQRRLAALNPPASDLETALGAAAPSRELVAQHAEEQRRLDQALATCRAERQRTEQELARLARRRETLLDERRLITPDVLRMLRQTRDAGWQLIRRRHVDGDLISEQDAAAFQNGFADLATAFEAAVTAADAAADRRFEHAEEAASLVLLDRDIEDAQERLSRLNGDTGALEAEQRRLAEQWQTLWSEAPLPPAEPEQMLEWLAARQALREAAVTHERAAAELADLGLQARAAAEHLLEALSALGRDPHGLQTEPLAVVLETAAATLQQVERANELRAAALQRATEARREVDRRRAQRDAADGDLQDWQAIWTRALLDVGLTPDAQPAGVPDRLETLDRMRELLAQNAELRDQRINRIESRINQFERDATSLVHSLAPELAGQDPETAVLALEQRLEEAQRIREARATRTARIEKLTQDIETLEAARRQALQAIQHLHDQAGTESLESLQAAIDKAAQQRHLRDQLAELTESLDSQGDGYDVAHLRTECREADLDEIRTREAAVAGELDLLRGQLMAARDELSEAARAFQAIGGDDAAARAAADRQQALARMETVAEQYVRLRGSALLLRWGIERYRREKQAPLLHRAGELFSRLTDGSFASLALHFDDQDNAHLAGVRPDGSAIGVTAMSTGTADQLYLALRVAAVEDYVGRAGPLPFVADDLFVNFDDARAAAGFAVLGELARRCQVIYFTHHEHLLQVAGAALPGGPSVIRLGE